MKKGFTIIELLVVIAIIGILAVVVLVSIKGERSTPSAVLSGVTLPEPANYAVDTSGTLSAEELADLNTKLKALDTDKHQFAALIVKTTKPMTIEEYGIKLAEKWKVGYKGLDNGAIIIIATEDRKVRIEVGYGLEGDIPDAVAGRIIDDYMVSALKAGKWHDAVVSGIEGLNSKIK